MNTDLMQRPEKTKQPIPATPLRFIWYLGSKYKFLGIVSFLLVFLAETLNILIFYVSSRLVDSFTLATTVDDQKEVIMFWGVYFSWCQWVILFCID